MLDLSHRSRARTRLFVCRPTANAGYSDLYECSRIVEAAYWAHVRHNFFDVHDATGSVVAPEALERSPTIPPYAWPTHCHGIG